MGDRRRVSIVLSTSISRIRADTSAIPYAASRVYSETAVYWEMRRIRPKAICSRHRETLRTDISSQTHRAASVRLVS